MDDRVTALFNQVMEKLDIGFSGQMSRNDATMQKLERVHYHLIQMRDDIKVARAANPSGEASS